jgi:Trypsin
MFTGKSFKAFLALVCMDLFVASSAMAIYINAPPNAAGLAFTGPVPSPRPGVGAIIDPQAAAGQIGDRAAGLYCSGALIQSNLRLPMNWTPNFALTAGHCVTLTNAAGNDIGVVPNPDGRFSFSDNEGVTGFTLRNSDRVRRHAAYNHAALLNDLGLHRIREQDSTNYAVPLTLKRTPITANSVFHKIGSGNISNSGALPLQRRNDVGFGTTERYSRFTHDRAGPPLENSYQYLKAGDGTSDDPLRFICGGDSGGPALFGAMVDVNTQRVVGGELGGVTSYRLGTPQENACVGINAGTQGDANVTLPFMHNWVDSYTRKAIFWDKLQINTMDRDDFEPSLAGYAYGENGLREGWTLTNAMHPALGNINSNAGDWRYFNAIGTEWDDVSSTHVSELYLDGASSQGELLINNRPSIIAKTFTVNVAADPNLANVCGMAMCGSVNIDVHRRWNSLDLGEDVGVGLVGGAITWAGLTFSNDVPFSIDVWTDPIPRTVDIVVPAGMRDVRVYLLNVPEPHFGGAFVLVALLTRRRSRK